jgi:hypothetical protein
MLKIAFNKTIVDLPYGGCNHFLKMLRDYLLKNNCKFTDHQSADVLIMTGTREYNTLYWIDDVKKLKEKNKNVKLIYRVNDSDLPRETDHMDNNVKQIFEYTDMVVFVSEWCRDYFINKGIKPKKDYCVIGNTPNTDLFKPVNRELNSTLKIVTHHFSGNKLHKGQNF